MLNDPIRTYDARWQEGEFSTLEIRRLVDSLLLYGKGLGVDTVTIVRDARLGCGVIMEVAMEAAVAAGFSVHVCTTPISTPQSYFLTLQESLGESCTMGITITASHNPPNYVGMKVVVPVMRAIGLDSGPDGGFAAVRKIYHGTQALPQAGGGRVTIVEPTEAYIRFSMEAAGVREGDLEGVGVVLDGMHGAAGPEMFRALELAGAHVYPLRIVPDGTFPAGSPNPTSQSKMDDAVRLAAATGALAIGTDGDGDRLVFGDGQGTWDAGFVAIPILRSLLRDIARSTPVVLYDPKVNPTALVAWEALGAEVRLFRNGHSQIKEEMRKHDALAAFEESGHYYHRMTANGVTLYAENSLLTLLSFLKSIAGDPGLREEMWKRQRAIFSSGELNYQFANDETCERVIADIEDHSRANGADLIRKSTDGVDLMGTVVRRGVDLAGRRLQPGWFSGYVRMSTNEKSVVRFFLSAEEAEHGSEIEGEIRAICVRRGGRVVE